MIRRVLRTHERVLKWTLRRPIALVGLALVLAGYFAYGALGSDLLPEMDEGAFILDYTMPAGSSLAETDRILLHVEKILQHTPEVGSPLAERDYNSDSLLSPRRTTATSPCV